jgi:hypothetical protein
MESPFNDPSFKVSADLTFSFNDPMSTIENIKFHLFKILFGSDLQPLLPKCRKYIVKYVRFKVFMAVTNRSTSFRDLTLCSLVLLFSLLLILGSYSDLYQYHIFHI